MYLDAKFKDPLWPQYALKDFVLPTKHWHYRLNMRHLCPSLRSFFLKIFVVPLQIFILNCFMGRFSLRSTLDPVGKTFKELIQSILIQMIFLHNLLNYHLNTSKLQLCWRRSFTFCLLLQLFSRYQVNLGYIILFKPGVIYKWKILADFPHHFFREESMLHFLNNQWHPLKSPNFYGKYFEVTLYDHTRWNILVWALLQNVVLIPMFANSWAII